METIEIIKDVIEDVLNIPFIDESDYQEEDGGDFYHISLNSDLYLIKVKESNNYSNDGDCYMLGSFIFYMSDDKNSEYLNISPELSQRAFLNVDNPTIKEVILKGHDVIFLSETEELQDLENIISVKKVSDIL